MTTSKNDRQALEDDVAALEKQLEAAKHKLKDFDQEAGFDASAKSLASSLQQAACLHTLLLLADSALPLGSFAFSSGLESFLAHKKVELSTGKIQQTLFSSFLSLSVDSLASTALPYVLAAYRQPEQLFELDNDFDASTPCTVARRASVAQGRALLSVWEKSFRGRYACDEELGDEIVRESRAVLQNFSASLRDSHDLFPANAHLAPLWGIITLLLGVEIRSSAYLFLFSHVRTVISAAVRANVLGPYQAQAVLASMNLQQHIEALVEKYWHRETLNAGQSVPALDLWVGRHEKLYSRIFNS